ncbi:hypothetical protein PMIN01_09457 [Paraphaeosphaeria minitans]|uniref:Uncharacterized protein n=1 Tax=Paraphaeosphaeria minitans TaxID=565426 RepID=A0A9P6GBX9_9PLEO|nr:hypothetical protein PMIN01_09457 [Paraphaeosphaeria minitans]
MSTVTLTAQQLDEKPPVDIAMLSDQDKEELVTADTVSVVSATINDGIKPAFTPAKSHHIHSKGIPFCACPLRRPNSSHSSKSHPSIATQYFFRPGQRPRAPTLDAGEGEDNIIKTVSKWTSRAQKFLLHDDRTFEWEYEKEKGSREQGKKDTSLVLTMNGRRIAALIRSEETRTLGSKSCSAGNGGELVLGHEAGGKEGISEELVITTVLLMLKKEIDRRRTVQFMMIAAAISG